MVAGQAGEPLENSVFRQQLHELEKAHAATGHVFWREGSDDDSEDSTLFSHNKETGKLVDIVAGVPSKGDARFMLLAHELVPHLLDEYRFLAAYYDKRQRETFTS